MIKYGLKIWSINKEWFKEAVRLLKSGEIDLVELYIVPHSFELRELKIFKGFPVSIHCPHIVHNFDIFQLDRLKIELFKKQIVKTADFLESEFIILHPGIGKITKVFKENIAQIYDERILIENMPKVALDDRTCFGFSLDQLEFIKKKCQLNICLDIDHAIRSAFSQNFDYKKYLELLIENLHPLYFHICGTKSNSEKNGHLDLSEGNFDLKWIKNLLFSLGKDENLYLVFETPKKEGLKNDLKNINYFKEI